MTALSNKWRDRTDHYPRQARGRPLGRLAGKVRVCITRRPVSHSDTETGSHSNVASGRRSASRMPAVMHKAMAWFRSQLPNLDPKDLFPVGINVQTGAIILGSSSTPSLMVAEFRSVLGSYGITAVCFQAFRDRVRRNNSVYSPGQSLTCISKSSISNFRMSRRVLSRMKTMLIL